MGAVTSRRPTSSASPSGAAAKPSAPSGAVQLHVQSLPVPDGVRKSGRSGSASGQAAPQQPGGLLVQVRLCCLRTSSHSVLWHKHLISLSPSLLHLS